MPLMDHFRPPLFPTRRWESFHAHWATAISETLNKGLLPRDYFAEVQVHVGNRIEVDVGTFHEDEMARTGTHQVSSEGGVATLAAPVWAPPAPNMSFPGLFPDSIEALIYNPEAGTTLVAAVELVSPGNKGRPEVRRAFAAKCATYLQEGVGLIVIDIVTNRAGNLHNELVDLLEVGPGFKLPADPLYATAYRPIRRPDSQRVDCWTSALAIGKPLPLLPLALDKGLCVPLDLEPAYMRACDRSGLK